MEDKETLEQEKNATDGAEQADVVEGVDEEGSDTLVVDELLQAKEEAELYKDRWMRLAAEFENYKKRTAREFDALIQSASQDVMRDLLPVLDAVDRALVHREKGQADSEGYHEGVRMIMEQFPRVLRNRNLKEIETVGQPFDPNIHEALMQMPSEEFEAGVVATEVEKGYLMGDKVIRPAKVVVSRGKSEPEVEAEKSE